MFRSYLYVADDPVAADETYVRLMALHPDRVIHIREELQVFSTTPLRRSLIRWGKNVSSPEIRRITGQCEDVGAAHTSIKENQTLRYAVSEDLSAHVNIGRYTAR